MKPLRFKEWDGEVMHNWGFLRRGTFTPPLKPIRKNSFQQIGIVDMYGKKIYDGDIVVFSRQKWLVSWRWWDLSYGLLTAGMGMKLLENMKNDIKVVGHKLETPKYYKEVRGL